MQVCGMAHGKTGDVRFVPIADINGRELGVPFGPTAELGPAATKRRFTVFIAVRSRRVQPIG